MSAVVKFFKPTAADYEYVAASVNAIRKQLQQKSTIVFKRDGIDILRFDASWASRQADLQRELAPHLLDPMVAVLEIVAGKNLGVGAEVLCPGVMSRVDFDAGAARQAASKSALKVEVVPAPEDVTDKKSEKPAPVNLATPAQASNSAHTPSQPAAPQRASVVMVRASDIRPEKIRWLWPNRFAAGKFGLIAGNPGLGKSQLTVHMAAQTTTGGVWPNGEGRAPLGSAVILSCEDDAADTLVPRLIAAGADTSRVHIVEAIKEAGGPHAQERQFDLAKDVETLCRAIEEIGDVRLVIIDPITAYLGTGKNVDSHKNAEVRAALAPLQIHASKFDFSAVGVTHLNKGGGTEALMRVLGSLGFVAAARVAFLVVGDAGNERTLFIPMKNNIGVKQPGLAFRVASKTIADGIQTSCIEWDADEVTTTADEALAAAAGKQGGDEVSKGAAWREAMDFLREVLSIGPVPSTDVQRQAKEAGIAWRTVRRAQEALGIKPYRDTSGEKPKWLWDMPRTITLELDDD
jgi:putative DNA primase/helicase